jgi:hypothetical protein
MEIAWPSFELSAGMEMAAAGIDEVCLIKVARRRIGSDWNWAIWRSFWKKQRTF